MMSLTYCVYIHINKLNNKKYIGQTCQNPPEKRWANGKGYSNNDYFNNAIRKYGWDNFNHVILKNNLSLDMANMWEEFYIRFFRTTDKKYGYNRKFGGNHSKYNDESKRKISINHANVRGSKNPFYKKHHSSKTKNILSQKLSGKESKRKGISLTEHTKQKMKNNHYDCKGKNNPRAIKINQFDLNGNFIRSYWGCMEVKELLGFDNSGIAKCCKGKVKTSYGYIWRYADEQ